MGRGITPPSVKLESVPCPLGCKQNDIRLFAGYDRMNHLPGLYDVIRCRECGLIRTNPRPTQQTMDFYYPESYGPYRGTVVPEEHLRTGNSHLWKILAKKAFQFNANSIPRMTPGRMLEIGCASGSFLHTMALKGWDVEGLEFSEKAVDVARSLGYKIYRSTLESAVDPTRCYDLIVGWMVFEHLHNPVLALQKLHRWISGDGWLVLSVPNAGSMEFKIFKDRWYALQLPNHLYHYTPATLRKVLSKGGWSIVKVFHQRTLSNLIASAGYWLRDHNILKKTSGQLVRYPEAARSMQYILYPLSSMFSLFGETGRMTVWARRSDD